VFRLLLRWRRCGFGGTECGEDAEHVPGLVGEYFAAVGNLTDFMKIAPGQKPRTSASTSTSRFETWTATFTACAGRQFPRALDRICPIEKDGKYEFATRSDDGSRVFIDDKEVVKNYGIHDRCSPRRDRIEAATTNSSMEFFPAGRRSGVHFGLDRSGQKTSETIPAKFLFTRRVPRTFL